MKNSFEAAKKQYSDFGVDVEKAMARVASIPVSLHCWQGDDVAGFENDMSLDGGIAVTGNYPGRARNGEELRRDLELVFSLIPGVKKLNLHASYAEDTNGKVDRDEIEVKHFQRWIDWAKKNNAGLDFNPTFFSHPMAKDGLTLSHPSKKIRDFWVRHAIACRRIGAEFGRKLGKTCVENLWIPDGYKDTPADRLAPRRRLEEALDRVFEEKFSAKNLVDAVECKLFGIGSESYVVGSHEFYMGYAVSRKMALCLDAGHFHPTEVISDKLTSALLFVPNVLLHVSRGIRWDSDHVVTLSDELRAIGEEIIRHNFEKKIFIGLDYFDASINRIAAWAIGARNMQKSLLLAAVEPYELVKKAEASGDFTSRLALLEEFKTLPFGAVWDEYCERQGVPVGAEWLKQVKDYEKDVLSKR